MCDLGRSSRWQHATVLHLARALRRTRFTSYQCGIHAQLYNSHHSCLCVHAQHALEGQLSVMAVKVVNHKLPRLRVSTLAVGAALKQVVLVPGQATFAMHIVLLKQLLDG
eukprot:TRINITY_DN12165_c0_g1_i24.p5 TRINITY_DN12165_c0_g1~~TRINITY_DN12165_c0_g1_i24.p5  ORF type:complete len:110 (-),score=4.83 TRINITY_DN12165_c0_g1_i24:1562-1891(-)